MLAEVYHDIRTRQDNAPIPIAMLLASAKGH